MNSTGKIRVLVVDDAALVRKIVSDMVQSDPDLEVVGVASNGKLALERVSQVKPDIVTLDIEMPEMNGIETVQHLRLNSPRLPILMLSAYTERGASETLSALAAGANDYLVKPSGMGSDSSSRETLTQDLVCKIKALVRRPSQGSQSSPTAVTPSVPAAGLTERIEAIAIGVSTGGPNALAELLSSLPAGLQQPIFITQHMPPMFTRLLATRLSERCQFPVHEASDGMIATPGSAYIAPGGLHLNPQKENGQIVLRLSDAPAENSCRPSVDFMFRALLGVYGPQLLVVMLTGMGVDGLAGTRLIRARGGRVLAQDEITSVVWGMPGAVAKAGLCDAVLPLDQIAASIVQLTAKARK